MNAAISSPTKDLVGANARITEPFVREHFVLQADVN